MSYETPDRRFKDRIFWQYLALGFVLLFVILFEIFSHEQHVEMAEELELFLQEQREINAVHNYVLCDRLNELDSHDADCERIYFGKK